ncbi:protein-export membrane protein SecF [Candidatus Berkelbacteria bacterium RIFCSPHIGHO2_12_FULL_36_9]|uniref:Protein-export membrane protein SecF n=1 Tax=Candidatus Berkelbacteria bacterium RIFCSPHIGHO2_12_FULL_36_9 TaxID=1797469 RepID=A0A1F5EKR9_9BACT|nr:MAG: protein-export membrane protein SecF [Candidatus Berkelbacteria bacterium RIFCSPHIGHO2_12_FULL_36_9]
MNITGKKTIWFLISTILLIVSIISLSIWGLKYGIDYKGGTLLELSFSKDTNAQLVKDSLNSLDFSKGMSVQDTESNAVLIRTSVLTQEQINQLKSVLNEKIGESKEIRLETVGPTVSKDLTKKAIIAVVLASLAIVVYIAWAFRTVPKPANSWRFGICAILALIHDIVITIGAYSLFGHFFGYEVDSLFITALLTVMGFSVHDTIVVFDRIRENLRKYPSKDFEVNANDSITQTLVRSLNTSLTLIIVLLSLIILGGSSIKHFIATLLVGVTVGTYSSIFNASLLLVVWQNSINRRKLA